MTETPQKPIPLDSIGQMARQSQWLRTKYNMSDSVNLISSLITPQVSIKHDALLSVRNCDKYVSSEKIRELFERVSQILIDLSVETRGKSLEETKYLIYENYKQNNFIYLDIINNFLEFKDLQEIT
jgi:hypothetical protein